MVNQEGLCRICMALKPDQVSIFNDSSLSLKLMELADVQVAEGDGLPPAICTDCEDDVEKCYEFRAQVQWADKKFREGSVSQIDVEEHNIKLEQDSSVCETAFEQEKNSGDENFNIEDESHSNMGEEIMQDAEENVCTAVNHVEVTENRREGIHMINDPLGQDEPLIEAAQMKSEVGPVDDLLKFMKVETNEAMDIDNCGPSTSALPPSMVRGNKSMTSVPIWSVHPEITMDESSLEMVQPHHGNHFLMDLMHQSPFIAQAVTVPHTIPCSSQNVVTTSFSSCSNQITTECATSSNTNSCFLVGSKPPQLPNVSTINIAQHEPSTINSQNHLLGKENPEKEKFSGSSLNQTLSEKTYPNISVQSDNLSLDSTILEQDDIVSKDGETIKKECANAKIGEFFCSVCDTNYWTEELFKSHLEEEKFSCRICMTEFTSHLDLKSHFLCHRGYRCADCKIYFLCKEDLGIHRKSSPTCTSKFECNICNKIYSSIESVRKHKHDVHRNVKNMYNCVVCDSKFTLPFKLNSHLKRYHVAYENMECTLCDMSLLGPEKLKIHKRRYHFKKEDPCSCSDCGKVFFYKDSLIRHEKSHLDVNEIVCEFCGKSCKGNRALFDHIRYNHKDLERINCKICNKVFKSIKCFKRHENSAHKPKIPVICEVCGKTLKNKEQLKTHLQIHSSERQYRCEICNATFKQALALRNHSRIHSSICKYNCSNCGKSFKWKQTFDKHRDKCAVTQNC